MLAFAIQSGRLIQFVYLAIDARADITLAAQAFNDLFVFTLAPIDHRRQQHQLAALGQGQYLIHHLTDSLGIQGQIVFRAARFAGAREQQAQVVVDLGDGANGGTRIVGSGLLLDGDRRRQSLDVIHVGLFHHRQELPGIGRQRLHVTALSLGINGVEGQRGLAGTGQAGDDDELVPRQGKIDVLQIVGARPADVNGVHL